jgi:hypothetical protein
MQITGQTLKTSQEGCQVLKLLASDDEHRLRRLPLNVDQFEPIGDVSICCWTADMLRSPCNLMWIIWTPLLTRTWRSFRAVM